MFRVIRGAPTHGGEQCLQLYDAKTLEFYAWFRSEIKKGEWSITTQLPLTILCSLELVLAIDEWLTRQSEEFEATFAQKNKSGA